MAGGVGKVVGMVVVVWEAEVTASDAVEDRVPVVATDVGAHVAETYQLSESMALVSMPGPVLARPLQVRRVADCERYTAMQLAVRAHVERQLQRN